MLALPGVAVLLAPGPLLALAQVPADVAALAGDYLAATAAACRRCCSTARSTPSTTRWAGRGR
jgi:hypothetical protein